MTAAEKKAMIKQMQGLMIEIVDLDKDLSDENPKKTNLKSPGLPDGIWGGNTDKSYNSILAKYNSGKGAPSNMDQALLFLNQVKAPLSLAKTRADKEKEVEKDQGPTTPQPKPAPAITDDQAKAAFRGLLESIQSGRIKLKAGSNTNEFRQRIGRDWGAIIRAYKGPQGVVDAFYAGLALTEDEKTQLVNINKEGLGGTSSVVGKINQKFLEAINTYIKPFGRALRTEKGMARVIDRRQERQERQERKQNRANAALKDLWILSKVAQRKEVARERLEKTAAVMVLVPTALASVAAMIGVASAALSASYYALVKGVQGIDQFFSRSNMTKYEFDEKIGEDLFKTTMGISLDDWLRENDPESLRPVGFLNQNYIRAAQAWVKKTHELNELSPKKEDNKNIYTYEQFKRFPGFEYFEKVMGMDIFEWVRQKYGDDVANRISQSYSEASKFNFEDARMAYLVANQLRNESPATETSKQDAPRPFKRRPATDPTARMRELLNSIGIDPGEGTGWTTQLNTAFKTAYNQWKTYPDNKDKPNISEGWQTIAPGLGLTGDIAGATDLVGRLIALKRAPGSQTSAPGTSPAAAPAPTASTGGPVDKEDVVSGLESLFGQILSKEVKVDQEGADMRRDSKDFRGVIQGLGGARPAAVYCVEYCNFSLEENKEIIAYKDKTLEALAQKIDRSSVLSKIYRLFTDIRRQSRRPFRRGVTQRGLASNVQRWLQGQRQEKGAQASISKSIEIRKAAARKKLGLQS